MGNQENRNPPQRLWAVLTNRVFSIFYEVWTHGGLAGWEEAALPRAR